MKTYQKILVSTIGLCCLIGTTTLAAELTETRGASIAIANTSKIQTVDARVQEMQKIAASKINRYDLRNEMNIDVYDQGNTELCWGFSLKTAFETTIKKQKNQDYKMSVLHMSYAISNSFVDGIYKYGLNRRVIDAATTFAGLAYITNGTGPVADSQMPFKESAGNISVSDIENKTSNIKIEDWRMLASIAKMKYNNEIICIDLNKIDSLIANGTSIDINTLNRYSKTETQMQEIRNEIKQHIINNGAVSTKIVYIDSNHDYVPDGATYNDATNSMYNDGTENNLPNHAVTIIGWDDNYSKNNFILNPIHDGAYIVQNSYGEKATYMYVSYDDAWIESNVYGITKITNKDYYKLYQHDAQGKNTSEYVAYDYYMASVFERNANDGEYLNEVAITTDFDMNYEVYINPNNGNINNKEELTLVAKSTGSNYLKPGYHTIKFNPIALTGEKFAVVVKYRKVSGKEFGITKLSANEESQALNGQKVKLYNTTVQPSLGKCFFGTTLDFMEDISLQGEMACIKAFTKNTPKKYNLKDTIKISNKDQGQSNNCWTMPATTVAETNYAMKNGLSEEISPKHMDYATSQSFTNGAKNIYGYNRAVNTAGTMEWALAYFTNGSGPIYEMSMPFNGEFGNIDIEDVRNKTVIAKVEDWIQFPEISKEITSTGVKYIKSNGGEYTSEALKAVRDKVKQHLMNNGAISTKTYISEVEEYYNPETDAYYCDDASKIVDHGVAIIGWDDDYAKENFNEEHRPSTNGAYIVQNSWGQDGVVKPQYYISYEDPNIEKELYGIINMTEKDNTETIYQYDELGRNSAIEVDSEETYGANVFERENPSVKETLKEIAISTYQDMNYEVYVNPNGEEINSEDMVLVAKSDTPIENGYHTIKFEEPLELTGKKFAVAVKYMGTDNTLVAMQAKRTGPYSNVTGYEGESYIGTSLDEMRDIAQMDNIPEGNICIKAFTNKEGQTYSVLKGDVNLDGHLTAVDIVTLRMHLVGLRTLRGYAFQAADYNEDGRLSALDLSGEMRRLVNM